MAQSEYMYKKQPVALTLLCVVAGALISALNINSFVNAGGLFPSSFNGLTILIQRIFQLSLIWKYLLPQSTFY